MIAKAEAQGPTRAAHPRNVRKVLHERFSASIKLGERRICHHRKEEGLPNLTVSRAAAGRDPANNVEPKWGLPKVTRTSRRSGPEATRMSSATDLVVRGEEGLRGRASRQRRHGVLRACEAPGVLIQC
jgi:hypothetical protein